MAGVGVATVTAKTGAGVQATAVVLAGVTGLSIDFRRNMIQIYQGNELTGPEREFDLNGVTTFTIATPGGNPVITIS